MSGELLTSCLARNARAHGLSPYRFLALFRRGDPTWERDFDRDPATLARVGCRRGEIDWLADLANLMAVPRDDLERATLAPERRALGGPTLAARGDTPLVLSAGVHHRTRTRHALHFCPACLSEGIPHFRKAWRLGFVVGCDRHGNALLDGCPHCDAPVIPHRSTTRHLTDCHRCKRSIVVSCGADDRGVPAHAIDLQRKMTLALDGGDNWQPWAGRSAFDAVRALLAVTAAAPVRMRLRAAFALNAMDEPEERMRFEQARLAVRGLWLETVGAWMADWPRSFWDGANAAGVTRRTFARARMPPALADEVARLPDGTARDRTWEPVLEGPALKRLRRRDSAAYRTARASIILAHCGYVS